MLPLYQSTVLMVEQPRQLFSAEGYYQVFDGQGFPVAHVREDTTVWNFSHGTRRCPHRFHILSPAGEPLLTLDKPWKRGMPHIFVLAADGRPVGSIVQDLKLLGSRFLLEDPSGYALGRIEGSWSNWNFRIFDAYDREVARISKQHTELGRGGWRTDDRYAVELGPDVPEPLRTLIVSSAITIDVLLHERDEDFYTGGPGAVRTRHAGPPVAGSRWDREPVRGAGAAARAAERRVDAAEQRADVVERRAERRAESAERRAESAQRKADAVERKAERRVESAERKADAVERRSDARSSGAASRSANKSVSPGTRDAAKDVKPSRSAAKDAKSDKGSSSGGWGSGGSSAKSAKGKDASSGRGGTGGGRSSGGGSRDKGSPGRGSGGRGRR